MQSGLLAYARSVVDLVVRAHPMRVLCVAEKPSIARALSEALAGASHITKRSSPSKYIKNFDFEFGFQPWGACNVTVTSVLGHLTNIEFLAPFSDWKHPPGSLFSAPVRTVVAKDKAAVAKNIRQESRGADILYIWTDGDREGEHIGQEIVNEAKAVNRSIQIKRAHFNNVDPGHLREAAHRPRELDRRLVEAVEARQELDLRTGYALTRFQTSLYRGAFNQLRDRKQPISYGSCQFPTLGFVVERFLRIKNHVSEPFWTIDLKIKKSGKSVDLLWDRNRLFDHMSATVLYERMLSTGGSDAQIVEVTKRPTTQFKPLPLTTVMLQKQGASFLKMRSKEIMDRAESLYNKGFISYPRTETNRFDKAIDIRGLVAKQKTQDIWGGYASKLIDGGHYSAPRQGKSDDKAHPPIHPVKAASRSAVGSEADWKVYEFVCRHFLACCSNDAKGEQTGVRLQYGDEQFHTSGVVVLERNYLEVYTYVSWNSNPLPSFIEGDQVPVVSAKLREGKTAAPSPLTEPELIGLMDANGIGTDATMADHIQKIKDREFIFEQKKALVPSTLGVALVVGYDKIGFDESLTKPLLRRETEEFMTEIAQGRVTRQNTMTRMISKYERMFNVANQNKHLLVEAAKAHMMPA